MPNGASAVSVACAQAAQMRGLCTMCVTLELRHVIFMAVMTRRR